MRLFGYTALDTAENHFRKVILAESLLTQPTQIPVTAQFYMQWWNAAVLSPYGLVY